MQEKKKRTGIRWLIVLVAVLAVVIGAGVVIRLVSIGRAGATPEPGDTVTAFIGDLSASASASGVVLPKRESILSVGMPGRVEAVMVRVGDEVRAGDPLVQLETADLALNRDVMATSLQMAEANLSALSEEASAADLAAAEAAVTSAEASLADLLAGPSEAQLAASQAGLAVSEAGLGSAAAELARVRNTISQAQIQTAEAGLLAAQLRLKSAQEANEAEPNQATHQALMEAMQALASAQAGLDALRAGPDQGQLAGGQASVLSAQARVDSSLVDLNQLLGGASVAQIAAAESQLAQAEASLASLLAGPTQEQIRAAEAEVERARLALADAEAVLEDATVRAPFEGLVTAVYVSPGEVAGGPAIQLVDHRNLQVVLEVDEVDVGALAVGQLATISLETWPDVEVQSEVVAIAPVAQTTPGSALITYQVYLALEGTDLPILLGMTANASLVTTQMDDLLLVPNEAIEVDRSTGSYSVYLVTQDADGNQVLDEIEVTPGMHDDRNTHIVSGLQPGDQLRVVDSVPTMIDEQPGMFGGMGSR